MEQISFYLDEHIHRAVAEGLRHRGVEVSRAVALQKSINPTDGSRWMLQVLPTATDSAFAKIPPTEVGGYFKSRLFPLGGVG